MTTTPDQSTIPVSKTDVKANHPSQAQEDVAHMPYEVPPTIMKYFAYEHLPPHLQLISKPFSELAHQMLTLPRNAELEMGLRKLLEAKDCFVRAKLG